MCRPGGQRVDVSAGNVTREVGCTPYAVRAAGNVRLDGLRPTAWNAQISVE